VNVTFFENESLFSDLREEWDDLLSDSEANRVFLTWEWLSSWWHAYQPGQIWAFALRDDDGRLVGIAPWFICSDAVHAIGCVDVTDYVEVIARRGYEPAVFEMLADCLLESEYTNVCICNVPENSPTFQFLPRFLEDRGFVVDLEVEDVCPLIVLPKDFIQYIESLDKNNRHELRRKLRKSVEEVEWYIVGPEQDLNSKIDRFMRLMAASAPNKAEFLENPQHRAFFEAMIPAVAARGWLQLAFATVQGDDAAAYLNFDYNNQILVYNSGLDPASHGHASPGIVLLARLIEHAIQQGRSVFDFLRGNESYKYDMGGQNTNVYRLTANREMHE
jgi:CelD/BcsL family acetyltransferase involved in cellulose biosynthesis